MEKSRKLLNRNFVLLWQGQFVSQLGIQLMTVALMFWIKHTTDSASLLGIVQMVFSLPSIILGPIGGAFADRYSRRKIIVFSDALRGIIMLSMGVLMFFIPEATDLLIIWMFVIMLLNGIVLAFFSPAVSAVVPDLVSEEKINGANSLTQLSFQISAFLGQGIGGLLYRVWGASTLFLINGVTHLFSAISEFFINIPPVAEKKGSDWRTQLAEFKQETLEGFRYVWSTLGLRELVILSAMLTFFTTPITVLLPFYVEDFLGTTSDWYGFFLVAYGVGSLAGYLLAGMLKMTGKMRSLGIMGCIILESFGYGLLGLTREPLLALVLAFIGGITGGFVMINITTLMQLTTPRDLRGRVFGLLSTISGSLSPLAMGLAGVIADLVNQNIPLVYIATGVIMGALSIWMCSKREFRDFLAYEAAPDIPLNIGGEVVPLD